MWRSVSSNTVSYCLNNSASLYYCGLVVHVLGPRVIKCTVLEGQACCLLSVSNLYTILPHLDLLTLQFQEFTAIHDFKGLEGTRLEKASQKQTLSDPI